MAKAKPKEPKPKKPKPLRVLLVDDHAMLLDVMRRQFDGDAAFEVVGTASTVEDACAAVAERRPDVVLLDIEIGAQSGLDAISIMRRAKPDLRVVMLSMFNQAICRDRAFALGAEAYVTKGARFDALRALLLGEPAGAAEAGLVWRCGSTRISSRLSLTQRELQVVRGLAGGKREKEIADDLDISVSSVGTYLSRAMLKTGVTTRAKLFRYAGVLGGG